MFRSYDEYHVVNGNQIVRLWREVDRQRHDQHIAKSYEYGVVSQAAGRVAQRLADERAREENR